MAERTPSRDLERGSDVSLPEALWRTGLALSTAELREEHPLAASGRHVDLRAFASPAVPPAEPGFRVLAGEPE